MKRYLPRVVLALALVALAAPAYAANTGSLIINANVNPTCKVSAVPAVTLNYDVFTSSTAVGTSNVLVRCTKGTTVLIAADGGLNGRDAASSYLRSVKTGAGAQLGYQLTFGTSTTEIPISAATGASTGVVATGKNSDVTVPVNVALDTSEDPTVGSYTDTVVLTFTAQ